MLERDLPRRLAVLLRPLALCFAIAGMAPVAGSEAPAQYDVEIIVFRNLSEPSDGEQWPLAGDLPQEAAAQPPLGDRLTDLPPSAYRMQRIADALNRSGAYRVLRHTAWRQTARDHAQAVPVPVSAASDALDGTVTLVRERYLHLDVELTLQSSYSLAEKRRVRSGELHYFDHPMFGVIAEVNPYEAPMPAIPAGTEASGDGGAMEGNGGNASEPRLQSPIPLPDHRVRQTPY